MMPRKHQRLYQVAKRGQDKRAGEVAALQAKRHKLEQAQQQQQQGGGGKGAEEEKGKGKGSSAAKGKGKGKGRKAA